MEEREGWLEGWRIDRDRSIKLQVYGVLRQAIVGARLSPGRGLSEKDLAELMAVSRTPVREALSKLADEGLVPDVRESTTCCYAVQDKAWVNDPDGAPWEVSVARDRHLLAIW